MFMNYDFIVGIGFVRECSTKICLTTEKYRQKCLL